MLDAQRGEGAVTSASEDRQGDQRAIAALDGGIRGH